MTSTSLATYVFSNAELQCIREAITKAITTEQDHGFAAMYKARIVTIDNILAARTVR